MFAMLSVIGILFGAAQPHVNVAVLMSSQAVVYEGKAFGGGAAENIRLEILSQHGKHLVIGGFFEHDGVRYPLVPLTFNLRAEPAGDAWPLFQLKHTDQSRARAKVPAFAAAGIGELAVREDRGLVVGTLELVGFGEFAFVAHARKVPPASQAATKTRVLVFEGPIGNHAKPDGVLRLEISRRHDGKHVVIGGHFQAAGSVRPVMGFTGTYPEGFLILNSQSTHETGNGIAHMDEEGSAVFGLITIDAVTHRFSIPALRCDSDSP